MHDDRVLVEGRIARELRDRVLPAVLGAAIPLSIEAWHAPGEPVPFDEAIAQPFEPFSVGQRWGRPWGTTWFRFTADVPAEWASAGGALEAAIDLGFRGDGAGFQSEGLVYDAAGAPLQGIHPRRTGVPLEWSSGPVTLVVEAAANPAFPSFRPSQLGSLDTAGERTLYRLDRADLCLFDNEVYALLLDADVLDGVMRSLALDDPRRARLLRTLEAAFDALDLHDVHATAAAARALLAPALAVPARESAHRVVAVGHAHIDTAWLWPLRETQRKCARTFASAVRLMDAAPDYHFVCSQAAQYAWIERQQPALFEKITSKVHAGQWVPVGAMWVEADMNLPSGESIARQLIHGQRYFAEHFGAPCSEVWLPDVFGYPASLPQVFAAAGCNRFLTQKLSWNKQNRFPHHTFWWEGLDGTRVLTHFPPVDTYNAEVSPSQVAHASANFRDHGWSDWSLMPFGYGNGGGGPTREMIERARRMTDLDGVPRVQMGTPSQFFEAVEREAGRARVPVWRGELYFEMHRGTLTSQTATKAGNRRCERLLREAELLWAIVGPGARTAAAMSELAELWREVLVQQFHDIIPGSSIAWVHADAEEIHTRVAARLEELITEAARVVAPDGLALANATSHARDEVVVIDSQVGALPAGDVQTQKLSDGQLAFRAAVAASAISAAEALACDDRVVVTDRTMVNGSLAVAWDTDGNLASIVDLRAGREIVPSGARAAVVELAPDHPVEYDAWDLESWARRSASPVLRAEALDVLDNGPLVGRVRVLRAFGANGSSLAITYVMRAGSARLDCEIEIDWQEDEKVLSLAFPLALRADTAACDIQFGHVHRPTHPSSPWDAAKFEVCAHRWVDISEPSFGVAVLNNGRYGHALFDGAVRVTLQKAASYPDPGADRGAHRVTVSVLPHAVGLQQVLHEAECLNLPVRPVSGDGDGVVASPLVTLDHPGVQLTAVKLADDGRGDLIVRLYEALGDHVHLTVSRPEPIGAAARCDLMEHRQVSLDVTDGLVVLPLRPFELVTLRLSADHPAA